MTKFQNMKIEINEQQPLDEVVKELERLGYRKKYYSGHKEGFICGCDDGGIMDLRKEPYIDDYELTTLAELKEMG